MHYNKNTNHHASRKTSTYENSIMPLNLVLSPTGQLHLTGASAQALTSQEQILRGWFRESAYVALLRMAASKMDVSSPTLSYWQRWARMYLNARRLCETAALFDINDLVDFYDQAPPMMGGEYLTPPLLNEIWNRFHTTLPSEIAPFHNQLSAYLTHYNPDWHQLGRVCFHLAENKNNLTHPFAFMATYTTGFSATQGVVQHVPLSQALKEYADNKMQLLQLLTPVQKAAQTATWVKECVDSGEIFHPQGWTAKQAYSFLTSIKQLEDAGLTVRVPNWWSPHQPARPRLFIAVGNQTAARMGLGTLLDFHMSCTLPNGETLTPEEFTTLLTTQENLISMRGQWVEVDASKLNSVLSHWQKVEKQVKRDGLTFAAAMRLVAGGAPNKSLVNINNDVAQWSKLQEGDWLKEKLHALRNPAQQHDHNLETILKNNLNATLRSYQMQGIQWLWLLHELELGGCLADDMGLGKTMQILALWLLIKHTHAPKNPHLLVVPASLLGNWKSEMEKFAPQLKLFVAHTTAGQAFKTETSPDFQNADVVMTTYASAYRLPWMKHQSWQTIVLDEAQNIKNPTTKQSQAVKELKGSVRLALTGTPVENRLLDLWSVFDFCAPGLLGSSKEFSDYGKKSIHVEGDAHTFFSIVRKLSAPYILRRLKTDRSIISDLPDKTESNVYCFLSKKQIGLYQQSLKELELRLEDPHIDLISRRGLVLSYLMRFKQICNHPAQWLGHGDYIEAESGKFAQLRALCEVIAAKQEKVLVFTQYTEIIPQLHNFLSTIFGRPGVCLHGKTPVKERQSIVQDFQQEGGPPFFVLSIKAGGTGLTLTRARHVIHFDRWWNPAVEDQATDRAYRIGQKKNVLVHKFICQGTLEEKIHDMIESKKELASNILSSHDEISLTDLSNDALIKMISLDIHRAVEDV